MTYPTPEQLERGDRVSAEMFDASMERAFHGKANTDHCQFKDLVDAYLNDEISSIAAIYLAMTQYD